MKPFRGAQLNRTDPLARELVGAWLFNEGTGGSVYDVSGNGNTGTLTGMDPATDWVGGDRGWALDFDGASDYVSLPAAVLDPCESANAFSIAARVYNRNLAADGTVVGQWGTTDQFMLWMDTGTDGYALIISGSTRCGEDVASAIANTWQHVVGTWDGTTARVYVDGVLVAFSVGPRTMPGSNEPIGVGSDDGDTASRSFDGLIGSVMLWSRALSAGDIGRLAADPYRLWRPSSSPGWLYAAAGGTTHEGAAVLTAAGDLTAAGVRKALGAAALSGSGDITAAGLLRAAGAATLNGDADLVAAGTKRLLGAALLSGAASITAAGIRRALGATALSGSGDLTAAGIRRALGAALLNGDADITPDGRIIARGAAILSADGDLMAAGSVPTQLAFTRDTIDFTLSRDVLNYPLARDVVDLDLSRDIVRFDTP